MSEIDPIRFRQLNDSNYVEWVLRMEAALIRRSLWSVVNVEVPDAEEKDEETLKKELEKLLKARSASKMAEARAELILRVEGSQLSHMRDKDPRTIWLNLQQVHRAAGFATNLALRRGFLTMKKDSEQSMQAWIGQIKAQSFRMVEAGIEVSELDTILALTMGLPSAYNAVIINFDATPNEQLTLNYVVGRLLNEEIRQRSSDDATENTNALVARRNGTQDSSKITCFFCDKNGHFKSDCLERKAWEQSRETAAAADVIF
jgi:hypothetical protein